MTFRLLVDTSFESDYHFHDSNLVSGFEFARGTYLTIKLQISNLSTEPFPGATIKRLDASINADGGGVIYYGKVAALPDLPADPSVKKSISFGAYCSIAGLMWINLAADGPDNQPILFLRTPESPGNTLFATSVAIIDRESLNIYHYLKEMSLELQSIKNSTKKIQSSLDQVLNAVNKKESKPPTQGSRRIKKRRNVKKS